MPGKVGDNSVTQGELMPRAVVHKKILDAAGENPETAMEGLADDVNGASIQLVERVLNE